MKRITLCETAYIDITDEQFKNNKSISIIDKETNKFLFLAKRLYLPKDMILIVPLSEFEEVEDEK